MEPRIDLHQEEMALLLNALAFAAGKHRSQKRKDPAGTPYINHPINVAHILYFEGGVRDGNVLAAAVLHDTVEDTDTSHDELVRHFGKHVADIVAEVTDDKSQPKHVRKQHQVEHAPFISNEGKLVKLADKISNLRDVHQSPPANWTKERRVEYYQWAQKVVAGVRGTNAPLEQAFDDICTRFFTSQEMTGET